MNAAYKFRNEDKIRILTCFLCILLMLQCFFPINAYAEESAVKTIKVGYFAFPGYHEVFEDENGPRGRGYGFDFLQMLRRYTDLNYQYIGYENSWEDMQQMLRDGEIDMVTSARKTSQREKEFAFSDPIGTSYAELCIRSDDNRFKLNDYDSFDGMTVGVLKANSRNDDLAALARDAVESYHRMVRKFTKSKAVFPTDDSIEKVIFMSVKEILKKWTMPVRDWGLAYSQFAIFFEDRFAA